MAKSPKKEQGNGKKFQVRQPGEKRNRKIDFDKSEPKKTKFFSDNHSSAPSDKFSEKKSFGNRGETGFKGDRNGSGFKGERGGSNYGNDRGGSGFRTERSSTGFGGDRGGSRFGKGQSDERSSFSNRGDRGNRFDKRDDNRKEFGNRSGFSRGDKPKFGDDRNPRENNPRFDKFSSSDYNARGGFKKNNPRFIEKGGFTGGDKSGKPRFPGDRSARFSKEGDDKKSFGPRENRNKFDKPGYSDKSRFDAPKSFDKPRSLDRSNSFDKPRTSENNKSFDRPRSFDKPRSSDKPKNFDKASKFDRSNSFDKPRSFDKPKSFDKPWNKSEEGGFDKPAKSSANTGAKGLAKFKPRSFEAEGEAPIEKQEIQKTYGIPKAEKADTPKAFKGSKREFNRVSNNLEKGAEHAKSKEIRLNRYIANSGICSRREADELILQGLVRVNGDVVTELGTKVKPHDNVKVEDRKVIPEKPVYIIMNKPKGYITTTDDPEGRKTVMELIDLPGKERIYPIGRLDRNTTGVLLLTNDGEMTQKLMHPSFEIKKVYRATLDRKPSKEHMLQLVEGVELEDGMMAFEQCGFVEEGKETVLGVEIKSGRNRIVRRMFEHFGYEVTALDRVLLGEFDKVKLGRGKWRFLTEKEMNYVDRLKRTKAKSPK
jgi:23S rRNA pseudouridine2605 synthase